MNTFFNALASRAYRFTVLATLGCVLALVLAPSADAQTYDRTVTVTEQVRLGVPPARAWGAIENFLTWPSWHPAFASTRLVKGDGHTVGSVRQIATRDGAQFTEELLTHDAATRRVQYRILTSPAPVVDYRSTLAVNPGPDGSTVVWSSEFKVKAGASEEEVKKLISGIYRLGLDNLATALD
jgi:hypothetical protein